MFLQDPPGYWSRRGALPKEGIAVTSLKGAGRGLLQAREGFSPWGGGLIYARHTAWMTRRYTIHQKAHSKHSATSAQLGQTESPKQEKAGSH